jgi:hypothetical protein
MPSDAFDCRYVGYIEMRAMPMPGMLWILQSAECVEDADARDKVASAESFQDREK